MRLPNNGQAIVTKAIHQCKVRKKKERNLHSNSYVKMSIHSFSFSEEKSHWLNILGDCDK